MSCSCSRYCWGDVFKLTRRIWNMFRVAIDTEGSTRRNRLRF